MTLLYGLHQPFKNHSFSNSRNSHLALSTSRINSLIAINDSIKWLPTRMPSSEPRVSTSMNPVRLSFLTKILMTFRPHRYHIATFEVTVCRFLGT